MLNCLHSWRVYVCVCVYWYNRSQMSEPNLNRFSQFKKIQLWKLKVQSNKKYLGRGGSDLNWRLYFHTPLFNSSEFRVLYSFFIVFFVFDCCKYLKWVIYNNNTHKQQNIVLLLLVADCMLLMLVVGLHTYMYIYTHIIHSNANTYIRVLSL